MCVTVIYKIIAIGARETKRFLFLLYIFSCTLYHLYLFLYIHTALISLNLIEGENLRNKGGNAFALCLIYFKGFSFLIWLFQWNHVLEI